jgi:hypothetical protein
VNANCCNPSVPHHGSFKTFGQALTIWQARLSAGLSRSIQGRDQTLEHLEEELPRRRREVARAILEEAAQQKADQAPTNCFGWLD